jgi:thioredoxin reductase
MNKYYDNIIIGGGPASLQLAYFFEKYNINYAILEKESICGSFFHKYPQTRQLISINKRFTGSDNKDFNLRHDWNSLLNDDEFLFKNYSNDFYPNADDLVTYLNDFYKKYKLNVLFDTTVIKVKQNTKNNYEIITNNDTIYECYKLIIATGLSLPNIPEFISKHPKIKHYGNFSKDFFLKKENLIKYENKKICIIGGGNSAYELANHLNNYCSHIRIAGSSNHDLSISSHYAGDIRSIYLPFLDTFFLKSLNSITKHKLIEESIKENSDETYSIVDNTTNDFDVGSKSLNYYDDIICCTGWKFDDSIFDFKIEKTQDNKYPLIKSNYESSNNNKLYFIGSLMHSLDIKKSSGGFIHGFRYLINLFVKINYNIDINQYKIPFSGDFNCYDLLREKILSRVNTASSIYQMYGVMCDIFYYDNESKNIIYVEDLTIFYLQTYIKKHKIKSFNCLILRYNNTKEYDLRKIDKFDLNDPLFLHIEIETYDERGKRIHKTIFLDDLTADFSSEYYIDKLKRCLYSCLLIF